MSHPLWKEVGTVTARLIEETGEVLQALGKAERFGYSSAHPDRPESNNCSELLSELNDLEEVISKFRTYALARFDAERALLKME